jgi:hypothetical protein
VKEALRIARSMPEAEYRHAAIKAAVEAQAARDLPGASATVATLPPDEQRGLPFAVAVVRARVGDAKPLLEILSALGADDRRADAVLFQVIERLLRIPAEDPASSPFWDLDVHPFR